MPPADVYFYQEVDGSVPVLDWLKELRRKNRRAYAKCRARIHLLAELGHELRRPHADMLRDGIYELRARARHVNYRILYFFHGKDVAILAHGLTKEARVDAADVERALKRKLRLEQDPESHIYLED